MPSAKPQPRWLFLISPRWLAWHGFAVFAAWGMLWLGDWQFHRAESGNALSWAYTFEWPVFTIFGVVFWAKTIIDELHRPADGEAEPEPEAADGLALSLSLPGAARRVAARGGAGPDEEEADDPELAAYNAYLENLNKQVQGHGKWHGLR
ncbi:MAG TPA: hypothetical protein VGI58_12685 [Streptosporangiaceae bacterium]|jgi:hypothetical protein